jgi:hypothetical protein
MNRMFRNTALSFLFTALAGTAFSQNAVDIGLFQNDGILEVKVRPEADFNGIFSSLVFTIRWDANSGANLGEVVQEGVEAQYMGVSKSGNVRDAGAFKYMVFAGFGMSAMQNHGVIWRAGEEYTIATIPVVGSAEFELVNDAYTGEVSNNADFYAALGGSDRTGIIYKGLASAEEDGSVLIQPNPNNGQFVFSFINETKGDVTVEMVNNIGQSVFNDTVRDLEGTYKREMDLTSHSAGVYYLKIKRGAKTSTHKIVYR